MLRLNRFRLFLAAALLFASLVAAAVIKHPFTPVPGGHGCVNAGTDTRIDPFGLVCELQRRYSYRSSREPKLHTHETWAWGTHPFYLVYNRKLGDSNWLLVRVGWRYDRNWRGYIGPSLAWKEIPQTPALLLIVKEWHGSSGMVDSSVCGGNLVMHVRGEDKLWALKSSLEIPLAHIAEIWADPAAARGWWHGLRMPGTNIPGVAPSIRTESGFSGTSTIRTTRSWSN